MNVPRFTYSREEVTEAYKTGFNESLDMVIKLLKEIIDNPLIGVTQSRMLMQNTVLLLQEQKK